MTEAWLARLSGLRGWLIPQVWPPRTTHRVFVRGSRIDAVVASRSREDGLIQVGSDAGPRTARRGAESAQPDLELMGSHEHASRTLA